MIDPDQYDGFATPEELNLTPEEIQEQLVTNSSKPPSPNKSPRPKISKFCCF